MFYNLMRYFQYTPPSTIYDMLLRLRIILINDFVSNMFAEVAPLGS